MMIQDFRLEKYGWDVRVYYAVDKYYAEEIIDELVEIGCVGEELKSAKRNLWSGELDNGIAKSNPDKRRTILVIGLATNPKQYANSIAHEVRHLESAITAAFDLDNRGEEVCYLTGEIHEKMWEYTHILVCPQCRNRIKKIIII